eukprot:Rmarinus@m.7436
MGIAAEILLERLNPSSDGDDRIMALYSKLSERRGGSGAGKGYFSNPVKKYQPLGSPDLAKHKWVFVPRSGGKFVPPPAKKKDLSYSRYHRARQQTQEESNDTNIKKNTKSPKVLDYASEITYMPPANAHVGQGADQKNTAFPKTPLQESENRLRRVQFGGVDANKAMDVEIRKTKKNPDPFSAVPLFPDGMDDDSQTLDSPLLIAESNEELGINNLAQSFKLRGSRGGGRFRDGPSYVSAAYPNDPQPILADTSHDTLQMMSPELRNVAGNAPVSIPRYPPSRASVRSQGSSAGTMKLTNLLKHIVSPAVDEVDRIFISEMWRQARAAGGRTQLPSSMNVLCLPNSVPVNVLAQKNSTKNKKQMQAYGIDRFKKLGTRSLIMNPPPLQGKWRRSFLKFQYDLCEKLNSQLERQEKLREIAFCTPQNINATKTYIQESSPRQLIRPRFLSRSPSPSPSPAPNPHASPTSHLLHSMQSKQGLEKSTPLLGMSSPAANRSVSVPPKLPSSMKMAGSPNIGKQNRSASSLNKRIKYADANIWEEMRNENVLEEDIVSVDPLEVYQALVTSFYENDIQLTLESLVLLNAVKKFLEKGSEINDIFLASVIDCLGVSPYRCESAMVLLKRLRNMMQMSAEAFESLLAEHATRIKLRRRAGKGPRTSTARRVTSLGMVSPITQGRYLPSYQHGVLSASPSVQPQSIQEGSGSLPPVGGRSRVVRDSGVGVPSRAIEGLPPSHARREAGLEDVLGLPVSQCRPLLT